MVLIDNCALYLRAHDNQPTDKLSQKPQKFYYNSLIYYNTFTIICVFAFWW